MLAKKVVSINTSRIILPKSGKGSAFLFDFYGTLVSEPEGKVLQVIRNKLGDLFDSKKYNSLGREMVLINTESSENLVVKMCKGMEITDEATINAAKAAISLELAGVKIRTGTIDTLKRLKELGFKLGLVSNLATCYKEIYFRNHLNDYFDEAVFSDEVGVRKPDQAIYEIALSTLGITAQKATFIGDHKTNDVQIPESMGMSAYLCPKTGICDLFKNLSP